MSSFPQFHPHLYTSSSRLRSSNLKSTDRRHYEHAIVRQLPRNTIVPALATILARVLVSDRVHHAIDSPHSSHNADSSRELESSNEHSAESRGVILVEVLVRALGAVEGDHCFCGRGRGRLDLFVGRIFIWVWDLGGLAGAADEG